MPKFLYRAKNNRGEIVTGTVRSISETEAEKVLIKHNLVPTDIMPERPRTMRSLVMGKISVSQKAVFSRQLATMISAGLSLPKAVGILAKQASNEFQRGVFLDIYKDLQEGYSFSSSLSKHPDVFDRVYVSIVSSGEATGKLDYVLSELADQLENDSDFISKVKSSLYYPAFILVALAAIGVFMLAYVIPKLKTMFDQAGAQLPVATRILLALSSFVQSFWWLILILVIAVVVILRYWFTTDSGSRFVGSVELNIPVLNRIYEGLFMFRFTRTMSMLIGAGVPLLDALRIGSTVINNVRYEESIMNLARQVEKGVPLSTQLLKEPVFPMLIGQMAAVGEETGELDKVLAKVADYYEKTTNDFSKGIASLIEPVILLIVGAAVAFMVFAIYIPIYSISQAIK